MQNQTNIPDSVLVNRYINGCNTSLDSLIARHKNRIFRFILMKVNSKEIAEDIFQDVFIKVIKTLKSGKKYNEEGKFISWVTRITHNLIIDYYRKKNNVLLNNDKYDIIELVNYTNDSIEKDMINAQITNDVKTLIEYLEKEQKEVLKMRIYNDMSFKEIAENTGVSINTALGRMRYAILNLRTLVKRKNIVLTN